MTVSYSIRADQDERLKREVKAQDLTASQIVRRLLDEYFASLDSTKTSKPAPAPTGKAAKVVTPA
jgi:hypothetical protein